MKNDEFRKLVSRTTVKEDDASPPNRPGASAALGAKRSSFVPMTPRPGKAPTNADFARQIRERHASLQPAKKFKSSAPKGSKFADGYTDRAKARKEAEDQEDEKAARIKALEEQVKLGQLPRETFETLRDQITGGDVHSTHLVKGLDRKLLERVRRGEDVLGIGGGKSEHGPADVDEELDKLGEQEVQAVKKRAAEKKGNKATAATAGVKRTRDDIMAELKAQRKAAAEAKAAQAPALDSRWRKVGAQAQPRIEIDSKGREVLITVDEDGNVKKKIRKVPAGNVAETKPAIEMPNTSKPVLGADAAIPELPEQETARREDDDQDDNDIFEGAGNDYNPLGDMEDDDGSSDAGDESKHAEEDPPAAKDSTHPSPDGRSREPIQNPTVARNYFGDSAKSDGVDDEKDRFKGIENVLQKAAKLDSTAMDNDNDEREDESREEREQRLARRAKMLAQQDRDMDDMDMGFGSSRFEDEEEGAEGKKIRLSEWKDGANDEGWEEDEKNSGKKKRKPKKRKGDVNNAADIMRVIEGRKGAASK